MNIVKKSSKLMRAGVLLLTVLALSVAGTAPAFAVVNNPKPTAKVTFTFDDGLASALTQAAPTLAAQGLKGTDYIITNCIGMTAIPNTCAADSNVSYMTWAQAKQLRDTYGWELGGHSVTHPQLATDNLTDAQLTNEVAGSKAALTSQGIDAKAFASPYGDYNPRTLAEIAKSYTSHRGFHDLDNNVWSYNDYLINDMQVQAGVTVAQVQARIDQAITNNHWLVLTFHEIRTNPSTAPDDYQYATADLAAIAAYVKTKVDAGLIKNTNISDGLVTSDTNMFTNGDFASGMTGWTTNEPANVKLDTANHGATPNATNSVSFTAAASGNVHLFSPKVTVDSTQTYMMKSFLNLATRTAGEFGYYIDEYDAGGNWISGQWKLAKTTPFVQEVNFTYKPTTANVKKASLQMYATGASGITGYVDNFQMFNLADVATPPPTTTTNKLANSNFDHGVADGWTTNSATAFSADANNNGAPASQQNAIKLLSGATNTYLFAPQVAVQSIDTYTIEAYLNVLTRSSEEVAFYIDEYDVNGSWISGQYAYAKRTTGVENVSFTYNPTSTNVKKAGLQVILVGGSGITGYLDEVKFMGPGTTTTPPPVDPPVVPPVTPPTGTNLITNGTFDSGLSGGWTTNDATNITFDNGNHGSTSNPVNAIKLISSTQNRHLFSGLVTVSSAKTYSLSSYLNLLAITSGEVGFYIDEYDSAGNWISGQYKTGVKTVGSGDVNFTYTPTSGTVAKAGLQIIVVGNSGTQAYFDDVRWFEN